MFKKRSSAGLGGFFEVFSDLIFGVMAIFVLLFVVILSQVNPTQKDQPAVDLVVAIDVSASMGDPLQELKESLEDLAVNFPSVIRDFRIGMVAYAEWEDARLKTFPLTDMAGAGQRRLVDWLGEVEQEGGPVDTNLGIETAVSLFQPSSDPDEVRRQTLLLVGDVGPYEERNGVPLVDNSNPGPVNRSYEQEGKDIVARFVEADDERRLLVFFPGAEQYDRGGKTYRRFAYTDSRNFFCAVALTAGPKGEFLDRDGKMMWSLLSTFLNVEDLEGKAGATC